MNPETMTNKQERIWLLGALLIPVIQCGSRCSWLSAGAVGVGVLMVNLILPKYLSQPGKWLSGLQRIWNCAVIAAVLNWHSGCWPGHEKIYGASLVILALAAWLVQGGAAKTAAAACVLFWPLVFLLAAVLLPALPELKAGRLAPQWSLPDAHLITVLLIPLLSAHRDRGRGPAIVGTAAAVGAAVIASGLLTAGVTRETMVPLYELSRSISFWSFDARLESLTAMAVSVGTFVTVSYLLAVKGEACKGGVWLYGAISGVIYMTGILDDSRILAIGSILVWIILPVLESLKNIGKKKEKNP